MDNDSGIRSGRPGSHLVTGEAPSSGLAPAVLSTDETFVDVDASVERLSRGESLVARPVLNGNSEGEKISLDFKTTNTRTYLGAPSFTHSDVECKWKQGLNGRTG